MKVYKLSWSWIEPSNAMSFSSNHVSARVERSLVFKERVAAETKEKEIQQAVTLLQLTTSISSRISEIEVQE